MDIRYLNSFDASSEDDFYFTHYHIRVYRKNGKLKLEALDAPIAVEDSAQHMTMGLNLNIGKAVVNFYLDDDVNPDKVRPALPKIWLKFRDYFLGANA
ncbi:MAG: hypothetical protein AAFR81_03895 [Chloroflexota bacterium]